MKSKKDARVLLLIGTKERPSELGFLLQSLITQTYQDFDVMILDDASGGPIESYYFIRLLMDKLRQDGHMIIYGRNGQSYGISRMRQQMVDIGLKETQCELFCRVDDDSILDPEYLQRLVETIDAGFDIASGVVPPFAQPVLARSHLLVQPLINAVMLDNEGNFIFNGDDCGYLYTNNVVLPAHHFRSCAMIKRKVHEKVSYPGHLTFSGFREEELFSFDAIVNGFTIGVNTGAIAWHLNTPSGGDRREGKEQMNQINEECLLRHTRQLYKKHGDFIRAYNNKLGISNEEYEKEIEENKQKQTNLIYPPLIEAVKKESAQ